MINDLLDADGELLTYVEFQRKYQLLTNFLVYEGIVKSIKDYIFSFRFAQFLYRQDNPILTYSLLHIHGILGLNNYLYKMKIVESDKCTFCNQVSETIQHGFETMLHDNYGLLDVKFNAENIIFGSQKFDNLLNELILIGKRYIFHMKKEKKMPTLNAFLYLVKSNFKDQKYNAVKNQTLPALEKR